MRLVTLCLAFVVAGVGAAGLPAQARPNFSGVWVSADGQERPTLTVKQDESTMTWNSLNTKVTVTLNLDGSETTYPGPDGKPLVAKMVWKENALMVTIHLPEFKLDIRHMAWTLDATEQLTIEQEFLGAGKPRLDKQVFKRQ
jgi:hypothetical protein